MLYRVAGCVNKCMFQAAQKFNCNPWNFQCICRRNSFSDFARRCFRKNCRDRDFRQGSKAIHFQCRRTGHSLPPW
ncbi:hypothetical protein BDZ97DRAFT_1826515 [Flammula alnicola]|nr:hypothetical protein BDZ97DRAFT_1826515 [Flammula alnicola]